jgi:hypothetical protein
MGQPSAPKLHPTGQSRDGRSPLIEIMSLRARFVGLLSIFVALTLAMTVVTAASVSHASPPEGDGSTGVRGTPVAMNIALSDPTVMAQLPGPVYDIAFDPGRNAIWFASYLPVATLYQYDVAHRSLSNWPLPTTEGNGLVSRVAVAPDGTIWVTEDYSVSRFDPSRGHMITATFDIADPDASALALSENNPSPGTWLSGITFASNGDALLIRHNVKSIVRVDSSLRTTGRLPVPASVSLPGDIATINGRIFVASYLGSGPSVSIDESGGDAVQGPPGVLRYARNGAVVKGLGYSGVLSVDKGAVSSITNRMAASSPVDRIAVGSTRVYVYSRESGVIEQADTQGTTSVLLTLPSSTRSVWTPAGSKQDVTARDEVGSMVVDGLDRLWYVQNSAQNWTLMLH